MPPTETREFEGHVWTVQKFTGRESLALFRRLTALAAEPLSAAVQETSELIKDPDEIDLVTILAMAGGALGVAGKMAERLSDAELQALSERLLAQTQCDSKAINFDLLFQGEILMLLRALAFVVEVNFVGPFVSSLGPAVGTALKKMMTMVNASTLDASSAASSTP